MVTPYVQVFENKIRKHFVWKIPIKEKGKKVSREETTVKNFIIKRTDA